MKKIKAIDTFYNGNYYRSRLEARWSVFFDSLQIKYEYEPKGFDLGSFWYLPDFYLPEYNLWIEIKNSSFQFKDNKCLKFAELLKDKQFLVIAGSPYLGNYVARLLTDIHIQNEDGLLALARRSKKPELCFITDGDSSVHYLINTELSTDDNERYPLRNKKEILSAYDKASMKRFEH